MIFTMPNCVFVCVCVVCVCVCVGGGGGRGVRDGDKLIYWNVGKLAKLFCKIAFAPNRSKFLPLDYTPFQQAQNHLYTVVSPGNVTISLKYISATLVLFKHIQLSHIHFNGYVSFYR